MNNGSIATRYSRALFEEAREQSLDRHIYDYVTMLYDNMNTVPEMQSALISPRINIEQKFRLLLIGSGLETNTSNLKQFVEKLLAMFKSGLKDKTEKQEDRQQMPATDLYKRFLWLVLHHGRENLFRVIILIYKDLYREYHQIDHVVFETATEMPESIQKKVADKIHTKTGREVEMEMRVRPELIGGFCVLIGDRLYDYSYHTRLQNIRKKLWNK